MLQFPNIDPVAIRIGQFRIYWYGVMYFLSFLSCWSLSLYRCQRVDYHFSRREVSILFSYIILGVIIGGALGNVMFYHFSDLLRSPGSFFSLLSKGRSFHGGLLGVFIGFWIYARRFDKTFWQVADFIAPVIPIGLGLGRLGNFINGELWGRVTDMPWGMVFPNGGLFIRHPTQLYEFFLEGVVMFVVLWRYTLKPRALGATSGWFLIMYGVFRLFVEFFREPDRHIVPLFGWVTRGMQLSVPMILVGCGLLWWSRRRALQESI